MPTYEYGCKSCGARFEEFQSIAEDPVSICPQCDEPTAERLVSGGAGLIFKGSGFYVTDYKKNHPSSNGKSGGDGSTTNSETQKSSSESDGENKQDASKSSNS